MARKTGPGNMPNISSMLNDCERRVRTALLGKLIDAKQPLSPETTGLEEDFPGKDVVESLMSLSDKGLLVLGRDGTITGLYPVSALPTPHRVYLCDGRSFYAMCAIDALGCVYEFDQSVAIVSSCQGCGKKIAIEAENGRFLSIKPSTTHALHVDITRYKNWATSC